MKIARVRVDKLGWGEIHPLGTLGT